MRKDLTDHLPPAELIPPRPAHERSLDYPNRLNLADELLRPAIESGLADAPAVHFQQQVLSFRELDERSSKLAGGLQRLGVQAGDRVMLRFPNRPEFVISWFAIQKLGAVGVATMPLLRSRELIYIANDSQAEILLVSSDLLEEVEKAREEFTTVRQLVVSGSAPSGTVRFSDVASGDSVASTDVGRDEACLIAYTSGSTGTPKGCVHFPSDILGSADTYAKEILSPERGDVFTGHPSLAFTFGLGGLLIYPLRFGASTCLIDGFTPEKVLETISEYRATAAFCAPLCYKKMLHVEEAKSRFDLGSLRLPVSAGETLPGGTFEQWLDEFGLEILDGIGATELFHIFVSSRPGRGKAGSTGEVVPGYRAKIVDENMEEVPDGQPGLLAVSGPTGCKYWRKPERQKEYVRRGWNLPGDIYIRDGGQYYWYQCRGDDLIITAGYNVGGPEVESVLLEHPSVAEAAVVASPDDLRGHIVKAFVVLQPKTTADDDLVAELQEYVRNQIAPYKYPREVEFVSELPRTHTGKIRRVELRNRENERRR